MSASKRQRGGRLLFIIIVLIPTILVGLYYALLASDQYRSETKFAVRGTEASPLTNLGLSAIPGLGNQVADAYVVTDYIRSLQVLTDMRDKLGIDPRAFFASNRIDALYRVEPDMPIEEFLSYWNWVSDVDFNSTTSIITFRVHAFSGGDAATISRAVLEVSRLLINDLSRDVRAKLIDTAASEVERTETRVRTVRAELTAFRDREQSLNPTIQAESDQNLVQGIQRELIDLNARRSALLSTVSAASPSVRVLDRQIGAVREQLEQQLRTIGSGIEGATGTDEDPRNLSTQLGRYSTLILDQEFAEKAYSAALASLETSQAEARKQERYFAIVVEPTTPSVALYPLRVVNTFVAFAIMLVVWLFAYLVMQNIRDHA